MKVITNTHLIHHGVSVNEYKKRFNISCVKDVDTKERYTKTVSGKTYEERYGIEVAMRMKASRSMKATEQMKDINQIKIRNEKCGVYQNPKLRIENIKKGITKETHIKRRQTMLDRYGKTSTLNLHGRFSKPAFIFLRKFCKNNDIDESTCYFNRGGINNKEYYQILEINGVKRFCSYDFVKMGVDNKIDMIIEYHGPYHYHNYQVVADPLGSCVPFQKHSLTKRESFDRDCAKIAHALTISNKVGVYWIFKKQLIYYKHIDEYIDEK